MSAASSSSLISIQKTRKKAILPKASLIKLFLDSSPLKDFNKSRLLPKLNDEDVITQFNLLQNNPTNSKQERSSPDSVIPKASLPFTATALSTTAAAVTINTNTASIASPNSIHLKKQIKDNKSFKQITRLCLYHETEHAHQTHDSGQTNDDKTDLNDTLEDLNQSSPNKYTNKQNLLKHVS